MKKTNYIFSIVILVVVVMLSSCKGKDPGPLEQMLTDLQNGGSSWVLGSVVKDGHDVTDQFTGFKLTVGEYTYTTVNGLAPVWEPSGTWAFKNDDPNRVERGDGVVVTVALSSGSLKLTFNAQGAPYGEGPKECPGNMNSTLWVNKIVCVNGAMCPLWALVPVFFSLYCC